ncbi:hypothetical protein O6H91_10G012100 [Diphasiastrum complanatum]|uniref:Uncharacterized protein n=1 Tax=Diphasiastrum complanatum TaxID=34168 RepID=A0ACC2CEV6_DIPCM|nr:hypothetical protein O6H91_10G012100 [Diphasiastrum complanatum]
MLQSRRLDMMTISGDLTLVNSCIVAMLLFMNIHKAGAISINYQDALSKSILFYEGQRSGKLPSDQRVTWRRDSGLADGRLASVDLTGGYYDAGDNVKFGLPMAFTVTMLSWAAIEYGNQMEQAGELQNMQDAIRWGTDYLLKTAAGPTELWTQVGDGQSDHRCWERPEEMDTPRTLYQVNISSPGTEIAAETAAALAAASIVFNATNATYSAQLLQTSVSLFKFADRYRVSYDRACPFYCSFSGYSDELLWGAAWLHKATNNDSYLLYTIHNSSNSYTINEFSWDNKFAGVQVLLSKIYFSGVSALDQYKRQAEWFMCANYPGSSQTSVSRTPGGLLFIRGVNNAQYVTGASFLLAVYSDYLNNSQQSSIQCGAINVTADELYSFAKSQVDYLLGDNPLQMSYMVGFGDKYPQQVHHRGASIPSMLIHPQKVGCGDGYTYWYGRNSSNPNVHVGALVGGPDHNDNFRDVRNNYDQLEPTTYMNAPLCGLLARIGSGK